MGGFAIRAAGTADLGALRVLYQRSGFSSSLAGLVALVRERMDGQAFVADAGADAGDGPAGAAACVSFGASGWVGGVAVLPEARRAGLGGALTEAAVAWLQARGAATVSLLATELGRPVYERLGFVAEGEYTSRFLPQAAATPAGRVRPRPGLRVRPARPEDLDAALALDRAATGEDRGSALGMAWPAGCLVAETPGHDGAARLRGWAAPRPGGGGSAVVATDADAGGALLGASLPPARLAGEAPAVASLPAGNRAGLGVLASLGYGSGRTTARMRLGAPLPWRPERLFSAFNLFWS